MKRTTALLLVFALVLTIFPLAAFAADTEKTWVLNTEAGDVKIIKSESGTRLILATGIEMETGSVFGAYSILWDMYGYPDDFGGIYYDQATGKTIIQLIGMNEDRIKELQELFGGDTLIGFEPSMIPYNRLKEIQGEITNDMFVYGDIYSIGIGWISMDGAVRGFGKSGTEFRVVVAVEESAVEPYSKKYHELYGDLVYVRVGEPILASVDSSEQKARNDATPSNRLASDPKVATPTLHLAIIAICCTAILAMALVIEYIRRNRPLIISSSIDDGSPWEDIIDTEDTEK